MCLFDGTGAREIARVELPEYTDQVFHGYLPEVGPGSFYGYRVHGPYAPEDGHRFNPNKLLLDPYARAHAGALTWDPAVFGYHVESADDLTFDARDSAPFMPKCVVVDPGFDWKGEPGRQAVPWDHTILYETHVKGFTQQHPGVEERLRGSYAGLGTKAAIDHIRSLGVTSVELLPIHTFVDDSHLLENRLTNYWGYNSIGFFAPDPRYAADVANSLREFKEMVARFHDAGLEVILDVVYNHTAEGNERGPTLSFKGIDNASYYRLLPDPEAPLHQRYRHRQHAQSEPCRRHPDGHRLAALLGAGDACRRVPVRSRHHPGPRAQRLRQSKRLPEGVQPGSGARHRQADRRALGLRPRRLPGRRLSAGWAEWNDKYRDSVRDFWRGQAPVGALAPRLCASADLFNHQGRRPWACVNFVTAHDGFTLNDLVTYNEKHNEANNENNQDGSADNRSWNCGAEGPSDDAAINALRERQIRNLLATLLLSQGTPMLLAGDEFGRTQQGNNNAYCQDSAISWLNWDLQEKGQGLIRFVRKLTALRHKYPILRRNRFFTGEHNAALDVKDVTWINANGAEMQAGDWGRREHALLRHASGRPRPGHRHPAARPGRDLAAGHQRLSRAGAVHPARMRRRQPLVLADRHDHSRERRWELPYRRPL